MPFDFSFMLLLSDFERYLYILEGLLLFVTGVLCYMTKDISGALNEARNNFTGNTHFSVCYFVVDTVSLLFTFRLIFVFVFSWTAIVLVSLTTIISFPMMFNLPGIDGGTRQFICSTSTFLSVFCTLCCLHGTRSIFLLLNYDIDSDHRFRKRIDFVSPVVDSTNSVAEAEPVPEDIFGGSAQDPFEAVKSRNLIIRRLVCKQQIAHWSMKHNYTEAMMLIADDEAVTPVGFAFRRKRVTLNSNVSNFPPGSSIFTDQGFEGPDPVNGTAEEELVTGTQLVEGDNIASFIRLEVNDMELPATPASTDVN
jgi:hypothetical protein